MSLVGMVPCAVGADEKPARPGDGSVSIEFRGDRIFIGVGSLFLELELIGVRVFDGAIEEGSELGGIGSVAGVDGYSMSKRRLA
jgi:hypothetical protein